MKILRNLAALLLAPALYLSLTLPVSTVSADTRPIPTAASASTAQKFDLPAYSASDKDRMAKIRSHNCMGNVAHGAALRVAWQLFETGDVVKSMKYNLGHEDSPAVDAILTAREAISFNQWVKIDMDRVLGCKR